MLITSANKIIFVFYCCRAFLQLIGQHFNEEKIYSLIDTMKKSFVQRQKNMVEKNQK